MGVRVCLIVPALAEQNEGWSLRAAAAANSRWLEVTGSFFLSPLPLVSHLFSVQSAVSTSVLPSSPQPSWGTSSSPLFFSLPFYPPHPPTATTRTRWGGACDSVCTNTRDVIVPGVLHHFRPGWKDQTKEQQTNTHTHTHVCMTSCYPQMSLHIFGFCAASHPSGLRPLGDKRAALFFIWTRLLSACC